MSTSHYIAGLLGPLLVVQALSLLLRPSMFGSLVKDTAGLTGLIYLSGILTLLAGLAIVRSHNLWVADWRVIITIFGWIAVPAGIARMLLPDRLAAIAGPWLQRPAVGMVGGFILLALGTFVGAKGYGLV